jgi:hypothetical protein
MTYQFPAPQPKKNTAIESHGTSPLYGTVSLLLRIALFWMPSSLMRPCKYRVCNYRLLYGPNFHLPSRAPKRSSKPFVSHDHFWAWDDLDK